MLKTKETDISTHIVAVFAFIIKDGKVLLAKRSKDDPQAPGIWSVPGGNVDMDEGEGIIVKTLKKEVLEEVGLNIEDDIVLICDEGFYRVSGHHVIGLSFLCKWKDGVAKPLEDQDEVRWFTKEELKNFSKLPDYFKVRVNKLLQILR
ncbi:hypothetical protein A3A76_03940 [Candidatus Woesebacteria bacterium RIFCSPLOWO2_01_FULL_39_23]|uniref:Nudix hydrolase domain-containing protein n=1 Tax=Candidatus Woesebacteria bacterium RIFCSPHIGHO2_01_FULL_40_22 TaxID=1802499 RepID=A0A1F7YM37_9BACT|nr:MAG: hypothetical protein A2141_00065 [Candidatus Woesebacteria bacterium RBG_16_40_11]OGM27605.1 MAG: hypothetical protein A2628_02340 [Candidatus Woesebacteria bacterium RIFCSPHIGHO2_01_FULL_40_22]OGM36758.1 MAG: hypothetical protein A3E41_03190 [Candidatus Woesebacteria bacterium RIFCSPHIGHO2_12_FULL_38_9]OGM62779.1 MAG: hypothetical protein A3A76_03940 [Candidatus Woesebacteria bacterium RIFCSPLOWO2_01_FULL_39_23]